MDDSDILIFLPAFRFFLNVILAIGGKKKKLVSHTEVVDG